MIAIDLLKGAGTPIKSRPGVVALMMAPFVIPVLIGILLAGWYLSDKVTLQTHVKKLTRYDQRPKELLDAQQLLKNAASQRDVLNNCLTEIHDTIGNHMQWSPVLMTLAQNLPPSVTFNGLAAVREKIRQKAPQKDDPEKTVYLTKYKYTLRITVDTDTTVEGAAAVQDFIQRLRLSQTLAPKIEDIRIASYQSVHAETGDFVRYEIDCILKIEP
ncbi:MAG: hypothetical protein AMJ79_02190 [Phycisphaerae bacterium SM23_30]|nr:MAG: hypothetical protein AMJ79_02190 [Phycisphaerae bacterium SM23_30]